jgi:hypothetical protein
VFYSVIETQDFSLFNKSAQELLKGYFIKLNIKTFVCVSIYRGCCWRNGQWAKALRAES